MIKHTILYFLTTCILILSNCSTERPQIPKTESATLNTLLESAPASIIQLTDLKADTLYAKPDHIMADRRVDSLSASGRLGRVTGLAKVGDSLYVADGKQNCIWAIDEQGTITRKISREGRGPGEFGDLGGLKRNSTHIFAGDITNARIHIYDLSFNLEATFKHVIHGSGLSGNKSMSVTDSLLYLSAGTMNNLISVYQGTPPFDSLATFHPRLIPGGMQPGPYNNYVMDTNNHGGIAVSYFGLPYIFFYDENRNLRHVVYVKFAEDDLPDNPPLKPVNKPARTASEAIGVKGLIGQLFLTDDGSLYFSRGSQLYHLSYDSEENKYWVEWAKFFTYADPQVREKRPYGITISNFMIDQDENQVYYGSIFEEHIYRFDLE